MTSLLSDSRRWPVLVTLPYGGMKYIDMCIQLLAKDTIEGYDTTASAPKVTRCRYTITSCSSVKLE
jgi:hypothetical protein